MCGDKYPNISGIFGLIDALIGRVLWLAGALGAIVLVILVLTAIFG